MHNGCTTEQILVETAPNTSMWTLDIAPVDTRFFYLIKQSVERSHLRPLSMYIARPSVQNHLRERFLPVALLAGALRLAGARTESREVDSARTSGTGVACASSSCLASTACCCSCRSNSANAECACRRISSGRVSSLKSSMVCGPDEVLPFLLYLRGCRPAPLQIKPIVSDT